jgi:hypothetical protein
MNADRETLATPANRSTSSSTADDNESEILIFVAFMI